MKFSVQGLSKSSTKSFHILFILVLGLGALLVLWLRLPLWIISALIFGGVFALLFFHRPFWGLCAFCFLIPLEEAFLITEKMTLSKIIGILVFFAWLAHILIKRGKVMIPKPFFIAFLLFGVWGLASALWAQDTMVALERWVSMLLLIGFFFLVFQMTNTMKKLYWLIFSNILGILVAGALGLYNFFTIGLSSQWRISAIINLEEGRYVQNPGHYGILLALGIFYFLLGFFFRSRSFSQRVLYFVVFCGLFIAALASGTRSFIVSFTVAFLVLLWYLWRVRAWGKALSAGALAIVIIVIVAAVMPLYFFQRVESLWTTLGDRGAGRLDIWKVFIIEIAENPILGVGLGNGPLCYDKYRTVAVDLYGVSLVHPGVWSSGRDPHSIYLQSGAELGVIGFILFMALIVSLARQIYNALRSVPLYSKEWQMGLVIALNFVALLVTGISEPSLIRKYLWFGFALIPTYARLVRVGEG
jgi:putative inorganic carbon (HCO3(-)) transporter